MAALLMKKHLYSLQGLCVARPVLKPHSSIINRRVTAMPYMMTPSKKGSLPKGVLTGISGSRIKVPYLPMMAKQTIIRIGIMREFINEKSIEIKKSAIKVRLFSTVMSFHSPVQMEEFDARKGNG